MNHSVVGLGDGIRARVTGFVYLLYFVSAFLGGLLANRGHGTLGLIVNLLSAALYATLVALFYRLFKPVSLRFSVLAALIGLAGCALNVLNLFRLAEGLSPLLFFGPYCLLLGFLIVGSHFLPRILGLLMVLAGIGWLAFQLLPPTSHLIPFLEILGLLSEGLLMLWLLIFGIKPLAPDEPQASVSQRT